MRLPLVSSTVALLSSASLVAAQTYTNCNPLKKSCPADPALGKSASYDFTQGSSSDFTATGSPTYGDNGAEFTVAQQGDAPLIQSNWYIMFGHVEYVIKAAPGTGIVSSAVLQSDDLDEIDWEWLGGNDQLVQTNYFGKGDTSSYNRGATHNDPGNHDDFHTYTVDWTSKQIVWQIDGTTVRVLTPDTADTNQYPQTPMVVKVGIWAGGDPSNPQGTIDWAGGTTDYSAGPYTMYLKSLKVTDYSTGSSYSYGDESGDWTSITANGGQVNGNIGADTMTSIESAPTVTSTVASIPIPWSGTHRETSSFVTPDVWPWVATATSTSLPSGWTYSGSRQIQPPSAASSSSRCISASSQSRPASSSPSVSKFRSGTPSLTASSTSAAGETSSATHAGSSTTTRNLSPTSTNHAAPNVNAAGRPDRIHIGMNVICVLISTVIML